MMGRKRPLRPITADYRPGGRRVTWKAGTKWRSRLRLDGPCDGVFALRALPSMDPATSASEAVPPESRPATPRPSKSNHPRHGPAPSPSSASEPRVLR